MAAAKPLAARSENNPPRRDPPRRHIDGTMPWAKLKDRRTGRVLMNGLDSEGHHYVLVYENSPDALADYSYKGYQPCFWGKSDVIPLGGKTGRDGEAITVRGHALMRLESTAYQEIIEEGRRISDEKSNKIFRTRRPAEYEPMRRRDGTLLVDFRNESSTGVEDMFETPQETA